VPAVNKLVEDDNEHVRVALASCMAGLSPLLGKEQTIDKLLNIYLKLFRDEHAEVGVVHTIIVSLCSILTSLPPLNYT
jgi:serine/threonine-protein phosphatase 2A regulatory subunit A